MNRSHTELMAMLQRKPFDRLFLGGPPEALSLFQRRLPRPLMARLAGSLSLELFASETEVLAATLREAEAIERREEASNLAALLESVNTRRATAGLEPSLEALHEGRVYTLLVADTLHLAGGECPQCHRLTTAPRCPACGQTVDAASDLRELAVQSALAQAAKVDEVSGEAAARLAEVGGMAAWTRF
jgi:RNA polymerase subunit RPABC4/transcription elongation factor Spt4